MNIIDYKLICGHLSQVPQFNVNLKAHLNEGWQIYGEVQFDFSHQNVYQTVVMYGRVPDQQTR